MKLLKAYIASISAMLRLYGVAQTTEEILHAIAFILPAAIWPSMRTPSWDREKRLEACRTCPIYNPELGTCGTPGVVSDGQQVGCWCPVEVASMARSKVCWMEQEGEDRWAGTYGE
jgi:hypothetical protein